jgi:hypothetical protein
LVGLIARFDGDAGALTFTARAFVAFLGPLDRVRLYHPGTIPEVVVKEIWESDVGVHANDRNPNVAFESVTEVKPVKFPPKTVT